MYQQIYGVYEHPSTKTGVNLVSNVTNVKFLTQYGSSVKNGPKGLYSESYKCDSTPSEHQNQTASKGKTAPSETPSNRQQELFKQECCNLSTRTLETTHERLYAKCTQHQSLQMLASKETRHWQSPKSFSHNFSTSISIKEIDWCSIHAPQKNPTFAEQKKTSAHFLPFPENP